MGRLIGVLLVMLCCGDGDAFAEDPLVLFFHQRPPYAWADEANTVKGLVAEPAERALRQAGIDFSWVSMPSARQIETLKTNTVKACGVGWFQLPEREIFARFSAPLYRDRGIVIIAREDDARFNGNPPIDRLFGDPELILLTKIGYSYGAMLDAKVATLRPRQEKITDDDSHMLDLLAFDRADYLLMPSEEADYLLHARKDAGSKLATFTFADAPVVEERRLMCSKQVPQSLIDRFDAALGAE